MEPHTRIGLANLTQMAFEGTDLQPLRAQLLGQCLDDQATGALMDLSVIDQLHGNQELGLQWQTQALLKNRAFSTNRQEQPRLKLLVFAEPSHIGGNTPIEFLLQDSDVEIITFYPLNGAETAMDLPAHDVAFCAAPADSVQALTFFDTVRKLMANSPAATINLPAAPINLDRDVLETLVADAPRLCMPRTARIDRAALTADAALDIIGGFPCIIRPVGSHAGLGLQKLTSERDLAAYLATQEADTFFVSAFIDYASAHDGNFRKYRIIFVDGQAFPCHMAIAGQWDLWYLNAQMEDSAEKRREEAVFMDTFDAAFAARHLASFQTLTDGIQLDYFGIDCAETPDGKLVVFEADNALIVHDMDSAVTFPYKSKHMRRIFTAFQDMLSRKSSQNNSVS